MWPSLETLRRALDVSPTADQVPSAPAFQQFLADPITAFFTALLLGAIALSGRFSVSASRITFGVAWAVGLYGLRNLHWPQFVAAALVLTAVMIALGFWSRPEAVPRYFGRITPRRRLLFAASGGESPQIEIGDSGAVFVFDGPEGQPMFNFFGLTSLTVELIRGRVMISTKVTDENGNAIAEITRNEWRAPPPRAWDLNYASDAVEVKDARGKIVLQVRALPDRIQLQGEWWGNPANGIRLVKSDDPQRPGAAVVPLNNLSQQGPDIRPMFVYPSETNLGRLAN